MEFTKENISDTIVAFFQKNEKTFKDYETANTSIKTICGINNFFASIEELTALLEKIMKSDSIVAEPNRREYGDFQTNNELTSKVIDYVISKTPNDIEFVLEPTCGKGSFILAAIQSVKSLKKIVGIEIYKPYVWETKFKILSYFLENDSVPKPEIDIIHADVFQFSFEKLAEATKDLKTLVVGNPPWVTNSELTTLNSANLPKKSNFKKNSGLEAMTGKGNFDIGESISLLMLQNFQYHDGLFAFLIKKSVAKNLIYDQRRNQFRIGATEILNIDAKKEFDASVKAGLFATYLNVEAEISCRELDFYDEVKEKLTTFGWYKNKFVYSIEDYDKTSFLDGKSKFVWRSGVKHDCSKVMELQRSNGHYTNKLGEEIELEKELVYGFLKSSDLKTTLTNSFRKLTIITQKKIGQETHYIKKNFPLTYGYLNSHRDLFDKRKSSIYKGKPTFSIFGIGDYSFAPYKVAISGLYKTTHFTLVTPIDSKPIMLDDTCYFIGFDKLQLAQIAHCIANADLVQKFLKSILFLDAKRAITKDILMRIDFKEAYKRLDFEKAQKEIPNLVEEDWREFGELLKEGKTEQLALF